MYHKIDFIPHTDYASLADNETARIGMQQAMNATTQNGWEVFKIEETKKPDGTMGSLIFYRKST